MRRIVSCDVGERRVGFAFFNEQNALISPRPSVSYANSAALKALLLMVQNEKVTDVVIGHPLGEKGEGTTSSARAERFAERLAKRNTSVQIHFFDEYLSTRDAKELFPNFFEKDKDSAAALVILQGFLKADV